MSAILAYLKDGPAKPEEEDTVNIEVVQKPDATYDEIVRKLYQLSVSGFPKPTDHKSGRSWKTKDEHLAVLKTMEVLMTRRKRIMAGLTRTAEDRIEPLSSRTKGQLQMKEQLQREKKSIQDQIAEAEIQLAAVKSRRAEAQRQQKVDMDEIDAQLLGRTPTSKL